MTDYVMATALSLLTLLFSPKILSLVQSAHIAANAQNLDTPMIDGSGIRRDDECHLYCVDLCFVATHHVGSVCHQPPRLKSRNMV
jgi:hypothetical protein